MKTNHVKEALRRGEPQVGTWLSLASPFAARFLGRAGFRWLTVDIEHSPVDWETAALMFALIADAGAVPLARVPCGDHDHIKRALDSGAQGIVVPMVNTPEEAAAAVAAARYPPAGRRSVGGSLHALSFGASPAEYYAAANREVLVVLQAEHVQAVENAERIYALPGIDAMFIGPNDLLSSMGKTPRMESDEPEFVEALRHLRETARRYGVAPGLHTADAEMARRRIAEGWQLVAVGSDLGMLTAAARGIVESLGLEQARETARY
jgi:4-hydroxy-2-oxoheptanedioate aldolase